MLHELRMIDFGALYPALSHPVRRAALRLLRAGGELCLCELMARLEVSQSSMSRHMACLKQAGLVLDRRDAQWVRYRMSDCGGFETADALDRLLRAEGATRRRKRSEIERRSVA